MRVIIFYTTAGCHLCEQAEAMLRQSAREFTLDWETSDIADDPELVARYGIRIPVLRRSEDGAELGWPFDQEQLKSFVCGEAPAPGIPD
jgi:hypothetical protein